MVTIYDIAKRANVSAMTVSRVINKSAKTSDETRRKVEKIIKELGYIPNKSARSLISKRTKILSLMITDITNPFFTIVARGAEDKAMQMGYQLLLSNSDENIEKEEKYIDMLISTGTDGVLIAPANNDSRRNLKNLTKHNIPFVLIDRYLKDIECDKVLSDNEISTRTLLEHLIKQGHIRIAIINGPLNISTAKARYDTFIDTLKLHGLPLDSNLVLESEFLGSDTSPAVEQLLKLPAGERPTAIFTTNNFIGLSAIKTLQKNKIKVPEEIAVVSYDDVPHYTTSEPFLTVAAQPAYNFGYLGTQLLIERIEGNAPKTPRKIVLPSEIHLRKSSSHRISQSLIKEV